MTLWLLGTLSQESQILKMNDFIVWILHKDRSSELCADLSWSLQALAHKTLVLLLGVDPSKQLDHPLPTAHPHVTYAYMKYMWKSTRKVGAKQPPAACF